MAHIDGTAGDDTLDGTRNADRIDGLQGADILNGRGGDDLMFGGEGKDELSGGEGDDTLDGGGDRDVLDGGAGNDLLVDDDWGRDSLYGGVGDDTVRVSRASAASRQDVGLFGEDGDDSLSFTGPQTGQTYAGLVVVDGGAGNDVLFASWYEARLFQGGLYGGDGDDRITADHTSQTGLHGGLDNDVLRQSNSHNVALLGEDGDDTLIGSKLEFANLFGGAGNDSFVVAGGSKGGVSIDTGSGDNLVTVDALSMKKVQVHLGDGHDEITVVAARAEVKPGDLYVIGFTPGDGGDRVLLADYLEHALIGWDGTTDPFAAGYLRLEHERHGQTLLEVDLDGAGTASDWRILVRFSEHEDILDQLTAYNFGGYDPELVG